MSLRFILFTHLSSRASALPLHARDPKDAWFQSLPQTVGWTEAPQVRGTFDLLLSCVTTLFLCAWTAYHPNVYWAQSEWRRMGHRLFWMLIAIFLPEVVLFCAWEQWWAARRLKSEIDKLGDKAFDGTGVVEQEPMEHECPVCAGERLCNDMSNLHLDLLFNDDEGSEENQIPAASSCAPEKEAAGEEKQGLTEGRFRGLRGWAHSFKRRKASRSKKTETWTMEQAFFALAGGYAIASPIPHSRLSEQRPTKASVPYLTLTAPGVLFLASLGLLPNTPPTTVSDKSKADVITKVLVCVQAAWFLLQCIARTAQKLPLSLLEIHVLTHVLCAFAMYLLWIDKPYDVGSPILVDGDRARELGALWALNDEESWDTSSLSPVVQCTKTASPRIYLSHIKTVYNSPSHPQSRHRYTRIVYSYFTDYKPRVENTNAIPSASTAAELSHLALANAALSYLKARNIHLKITSYGTAYRNNSSPSLSADEPDITVIPHTHISLPELYFVSTRSNLLLDGVLSFDKDADRATSLARWMKAYAVLGAGYAGLHLAAWNFAFATPGERWAWRASGIVMVVAPVASVVMALGFGVNGWVSKTRRGRENRGHSVQGNRGEAWWHRMARKGVKGLVVALLWSVDSFAMNLVYLSCIVACFAWVAYPVVRVFVLVESFAGLRSVEKGVYQTVEWTGFIPHAG